MDKNIFDVSKLTLDPSGRTVINDDEMQALEQAQMNTAGGWLCPQLPCDDGFATTNQFSCDRTSNQAGCDNGWSCDRSSNNDCVNARACDGSKNTKSCKT
jgi:hypothetical protein